MAAAGVTPEIHAGRRRAALPPGVCVQQPCPAVGNRLPWRLVKAAAVPRLEAGFRAALADTDPETTVAHFWPGTPSRLVAEALDRGIVTVREMINSPCATAGPILDAAYARLGLPATHGLSASVIEGETEELKLYDYFFASNPEVERSLLALGVGPHQILATTFGWRPDRFTDQPPIARTDGFRAVFVGRIGVRKGVPELLEGWESAGINGELVLAGPIDDEIAGLVESYTGSGRVRLWGYVDNPGGVYAGSDVFVFPTWEEGGPQVTYEAAGCGLPVITTPMGAARLVEHERTGLLIDPGSPRQIADAIRTLAGDASARHAYGTAARAAAASFTYGRVGSERADLLREILRVRHSS
ncbi:glycosyltransferase family 4 protein [Cellulomonas fimi]|uniref:Glycosyltransferase family 4 protein n=2 Tax=Cellulomonas fimi TaxID=1708 RepID=A0A7Y0M1H9_CELFI|nr:glycosyltransferase family 4 protein [Cellulomonas fimi]